MEALCTIDDVQLIRLIRRDDRTRLFVGTTETGIQSLVQLFDLPAGEATNAQVERHLKLVRALMAAGATGTPRILGMGRKAPSSLFLITEDPVGLPLAEVIAQTEEWVQRGGRAWLATLCGLLAHLHGHGLASGRVLSRHLLVGQRGAPILTEPLTTPLLHRINGAIPFQDPAFLRLHLDAGATPPEVLGGASPAPPGDVFQVGVILHRLWTGQPPFGDGSTLEVFNRVRSGRPAHPFPGDDAALAAAATACLAPRPEDRPTAEELAQTLGADAAEGLPPGHAAERRYSDLFPTLLRGHDGEGGAGEVPAPPENAVPTDSDREQALAQLDVWLAKTSTQHQSGADRRSALTWLLGVVMVSAAALLLWSSGFGAMEPNTSSRVPERGGLTHAPSSRSSSGARARSWHMDSLPENLSAALDQLGIPNRDLPLKMRKVGEDCVVVTGAPGDVRHRFVFPRCRDLARICALGPDEACAPGADGTHELRVLYDPDGRPLLLQALDGDGAVLRNIEIN